MFSAGDCFLIETNLDSQEQIQFHFHIVVIDVVEPAGIMIIVPCESFTSKKQDKTTILKKGDHEFIKRDTYVNYGRSTVFPSEDLDNLIKGGIAKVKKPLEQSVLHRVQQGIMKSDKTNYEVRDLYEEEMLYKRLN